MTSDGLGVVVLGLGGGVVFTFQTSRYIHSLKPENRPSMAILIFQPSIVCGELLGCFVRQDSVWSEGKGILWCTGIKLVDFSYFVPQKSPTNWGPGSSYKWDYNHYLWHWGGCGLPLDFPCFKTFRDRKPKKPKEKSQIGRKNCGPKPTQATNCAAIDFGAQGSCSHCKWMGQCQPFKARSGGVLERLEMEGWNLTSHITWEVIR